MVAFGVKATLQAMQSHLKASGYFQDVLIGEPKGPPGGNKPTAALFMNSASVVQIMLDGGTVESHIVTLRVYRNMLQESTEKAETDLAEAVSKTSEDILGEFDLGGNIRNVDAAGMHGSGVRFDWGYIQIDQTMFRICDITVPLIVDNSVTMAA